MERMTHNLRQVLSKSLLSTAAAKRRVLTDIAGAIAHLHSRRILHRDIKPENVLLRVSNGRIVRRAKVSDFSVSRKAQQTDLWTTSMHTAAGIIGTLAYMPLEAFKNSGRDPSNWMRDVWSFGVLI